MIPHLLVVDQFFSRPEKVRAFAELLQYGPAKDHEGVEYPNVSLNVPDSVKNEVSLNLNTILGQPITINKIGFRLNLLNDPQPYWAHNDVPMGQFNLIVTLTNDEYCQGGTVVLKHETGMNIALTEKEMALVRQDTNDESKWTVISASSAAFNRAVIVPSYLFHARMPKAGFGRSIVDGRLVLLAFFSYKEE